jgi:hypothetical protein
MREPKTPLSRRSLILAVGTAMALLSQRSRTVSAGENTISAQEKVSKEKAEYQDAPKDIRMCATCSLFLPPKACKVVEGEVSPSGWCNLFDLAD